MVFLIIISCLLSACFIFTPPIIYEEVKRIGININEKNLSIIIDVGCKKTGYNTLPFFIAIYQDVTDIQSVFARKNNKISQISDDITEFREFLVFAAHLSRDWEKTKDDLSYPFIYKSRRLELINIEIERNGNYYLINKIGDYLYSDASDGLVLGNGYFNENVEYLIVLYPYYNHRFLYTAITPIRFTIINGIPIIWINDY